MVTKHNCLHFYLLEKVFIKSIRSANLLTKQDISILFINWKDLIVANTKLLKSLRIRQTMQQQQATVGDILCENVGIWLRRILVHINKLSPHLMLGCFSSPR